MTGFGFGLAHRPSSGPGVKTGARFRICNLDRSREVSAVIRTVLTLADNRHENESSVGIAVKAIDVALIQPPGVSILYRWEVGCPGRFVAAKDTIPDRRSRRRRHRTLKP